MKVKKNNAPCFGCVDRRVGCHSGCEKYSKYTQTINSQKEERYSRIKKNSDYYSVRGKTLYFN